MTSLQAIKPNTIPPVINGQTIHFFIQKDYIIPPQSCILISLGHSVNNIKSGYSLQLDSSVSALSQGLIATKGQYSQNHKGQQIMTFIRNTSDTFVKIQKGFNIVKGILKSFGIDILEILPFLALEQKKNNRRIIL